MSKPKPIDDSQLRNKNTVTELQASRDENAKLHIKNLDRIKQVEQVKEWLEKVQKL